MYRTVILEPRSESCYFIRYPKGTRGGIFYHPKEQKVFFSTHARYLENGDMIQKTLESEIVLEEISYKSSEKLVHTVHEQQQHVTPNTSEPRRSGKISRPPNRCYGESFQTSLEDQVEDPTRYDEAVTDIDADHWHKAMDSEIESMYSNKVWDLVALPEGVKPIR